MCNNQEVRKELLEVVKILQTEVLFYESSEQLKYTLETMSERLMELDQEVIPDRISKPRRYQSA